MATDPKAISMNVLVEARNEYLFQLRNYLTPRIYEGLKHLFEEANKENEPEYLKTFQKLLTQIPKWNQDIIDNETDRILKQSNCEWLDKLITVVFISNTRILTAVRMNSSTDNIQITIPKLSHFIHRTYVECAREIYKNPYLFERGQGIRNMDLQRNYRETLILIDECINNTVRKLLPIQDIVQQYLGESTNPQNEFDKISEEPESVQQQQPLNQLGGAESNDNHSGSDNESENSDSDSEEESDNSSEESSEESSDNSEESNVESVGGGSETSSDDDDTDDTDGDDDEDDNEDDDEEIISNMGDSRGTTGGNIIITENNEIDMRDVGSNQSNNQSNNQENSGNNLSINVTEISAPVENVKKNIDNNIEDLRLLINKPIENMQNNQLDPSIFRKNPDVREEVLVNMVPEHRSIVMPATGGKSSFQTQNNNPTQIKMQQPVSNFSVPTIKKIKSKFIQVKKNHNPNVNHSMNAGTGSINFSNSSVNKRVSFF